MTEYLNYDDIVDINSWIIDIYSPNEPKIVISYEALDMAVQSPQQEVFGKVLYPTIEEKGANLYMNLATRHPFGNANKRTAFMSLDVFLQKNGKYLDVDTDEATLFTMRVVNENLDQATIVLWIKRYIKDI